MIVKLDIDLHGAGFLLRGKQGCELSRLAGGNETEEMLQPKFVAQPPVLWGQLGGKAAKTRCGDCFDFLLQRPFALGRRMALQ